jgi:hypothetical protein
MEQPVAGCDGAFLLPWRGGGKRGPAVARRAQVRGQNLAIMGLDGDRPMSLA